MLHADGLDSYTREVLIVNGPPLHQMPLCGNILSRLMILDPPRWADKGTSAGRQGQQGFQGWLACVSVLQFQRTGKCEFFLRVGFKERQISCMLLDIVY